MVVAAQVSIGISIIIFLVMFVLQFYRVRMKKRDISVIRFVLVAALMLIAGATWLGYGSDMSRYFLMLRQMEGQSLQWALEFGRYKSTIVANVFFWLVAQMRNERLLSAISTGLVMVNVLWLLRKGDPDNRYINVQCTYLLQLFAICTFSAIMTGVRQQWMFSVYSIAIHRDVVEKKRDWITIILYAICCGIHISGLFFVGIRVLSIVRSKIRYLFLFWTFLIPFLQVFANQSGILGEMVQKLLYYQRVENLDVRWLAARLGIVLVLIFMWFCVKKRTLRADLYMRYMETQMILTVGSIPIQHLFSRMVAALVYTSLPLLIDYHQVGKKTEKQIVQILLTVLILGLYAYQLVFMRASWELF